MKHAYRILALALLAWPAGGAGPAAAQAPAQGVVSGRVVDAELGAPLSGASIMVVPAGGGALPAPGGRPAFLPGSRSVVTDSLGAYRVEGLATGEYRLYVERLGYRPAALTVELRHAADPTISIALEIEPVTMEPLEVNQTPAAPFGRTRTAAEEVDGSRVAAERLRQRDHLASDVRTLTHGEVLEAVTLGETDLFRALQRLPGVGTRDDFSADLWTRGAGWEQTRVYFDGLPLLNPLHGVGVLSGVGPDGVGALLLHPGVRPARLGEGAAAVVDLSTRRGGGDGELRGYADLSLASARLALDQSVLGGRGAWMLAGRRTYLDWLTGAAERAGAGDVHLPYAFHDVTGRFDLGLGAGRSLEASGLWSRDRKAGGSHGDVPESELDWGNAAGRVTLQSPLLGATVRHTVGASRYAAGSSGTVPGAEPDARPEPAVDHALLHASLGSELEGRAGWRAGYQLVRQGMEYAGPAAPTYYRSTGSDSSVARSDGLAYGVLWAERRGSPVRGLTLDAGLRAEMGPAVRNGGAARIAPRLSARYDLGSGATLSAGLGRSYQYSQAVSPLGPELLSMADIGHLWLLAGDDVPAVRADVATLGFERWLGAAWLASANAYARRATGVAVPDPAPGSVAGRPLFVEAENTAHGAEIGVRRLAGRWTASASYSYGVSELESGGRRYAAPADRRHGVDATLLVRLSDAWRLGAGYTATTGAPYTRVMPGAEPCGYLYQPACPPAEVAGEPGAERGPGYASLDLLADWGRDFGGWQLGVYVQVRNALFRDNASTYTGSTWYCPGSGHTWLCPGGHQPLDQFERGLPILPLVGARISF